MTRVALAARSSQQPPLEAEGTLSSAFVGRLTAWAEEQGFDTPLFCLAPELLRSGVAHLREQLGARISYATKANSHSLVLQELATLVDEFNVTNVVHLEKVLALGIDPARLAWLHPVLTPEIAETVVARGVRRFVIDDERGLDLLSATGAHLAVTLRLLPPDTGESEHSVVRFGNTASALCDLACRARAAGLDVEAISFFVGTNGAGMREALPFRAGIQALAKLHAELHSDGVTVPTFNIGGGFPGSRRRFYLDHPDFFSRIRDTLRAELGSGVDVLCEPGRYLVEPSMLMLARVLSDRVLAGRRLVSVDASAYGGLFESCFIEPGEQTVWTGAGSEASTPADLLGPVMDSFDVIRKGGQLPPLREGEILALPNVGAYSIGYSTECEGLRAPGVVVLPDELSAALGDRWYD
jgi:diaminopimelate decarboxylase